MSEITGTVQTQGTQPITIAGLPACPPWCGGDCVGHDDRLHEKVLTEFVAVDSDSHEDNPREVNVRVLIERYDTNRDAHLVAEPIRTRMIVEFVHELFGKTRVIRAALTPEQLRALSVSAFHGSVLLDEADVSGDCEAAATYELDDLVPVRIADPDGSDH